MIVAAGALLIGGAAGVVQAQSLGQKGYQSVEQVVGDIDPLHVSQRQVETGLGEFGQGSSVFRRIDPTGPAGNRLYFITPGFIAEYDRSSYFDFEDKHGNNYTAQEVPANTVFRIGLPPAPEAPRRDPVPGMVDAQVDGRSDGRRRTGPAPIDASMRQAPAPVERVRWMQYLQARVAQRQAVAQAMDRLAAAKPEQP